MLHSFSSHIVIVLDFLVPLRIVLFGMRSHIEILRVFLHLMGLALFLFWLFLFWLILLILFMIVLLGFFQILLASVLSFNQQRSIKNFSVDLYHFFLVFTFSFSFFLFKLFNFRLNESSRMTSISHTTFSEDFSDIRCKLLLSHFSDCFSFFFLLYFFDLLLFLFFPQIYQSHMLLSYRNVNLFLLFF